MRTQPEPWSSHCPSSPKEKNLILFLSQANELTCSVRRTVGEFSEDETFRSSLWVNSASGRMMGPSLSIIHFLQSIKYALAFFLSIHVRGFCCDSVGVLNNCRMMLPFLALVSLLQLSFCGPCEFSAAQIITIQQFNACVSTMPV
jgi:hypothetical protein